ncbi:MAG: hypothetical protein PHG87_02195 [Candidatus Omnitrophica bacterium]|nr:hypothetical protein [Candidatus Omnitrophota bacterium]
MSIINEALKKTEQYIQQNEAKKNSFLDKKSGPRPFLLYILILLLGISLSSFIFSLLGDKIKTAQAPNKTAIALQQPVVLAPLPEEPALAKKEEKNIPEAAFVLNGIFFSDNDGYALINNQIVRENDSVDGAKVMKIAANTVELNNQEKLITLSTRR